MRARAIRPSFCCRGGLTGWQSWLPLLPALSRNCAVVRVQPICNAEGLAGRPGAPDYDADVERESIDLTLGAAGVSDMHLIGWSNGGRMALDFALAFPERIRTLTWPCGHRLQGPTPLGLLVLVPPGHLLDRRAGHALRCGGHRGLRAPRDPDAADPWALDRPLAALGHRHLGARDAGCLCGRARRWPRLPPGKLRGVRRRTREPCRLGIRGKQ